MAAARRLADPEVAKRRGEPPVDVVIIGRGGGSPEDLWAFNLEPVVRTMLVSPVPVVSAVGHESDLLVTDLVADVRASTPSNAIERVVPIYNELYYFFDEVGERIDVASRRQITDSQQRLLTLHARLKVAPLTGINRAKQRTLELSSRLKSATESTLNSNKTLVARFETSLNATHPQRVLERGYSMTQTEEGAVLSSVEDIQQGQTIILNFADGHADAEVKKIQTRGGKDDR
jgi:exodeoxyribonuclease VII large subunit